MTFSVSTKSNIDRWLRQADVRRKRFETKLSATPQQSAEYGATLAKTLTPRDTGALFQSIVWRRVGSKKRGSGEALIVVRKNPLNPKEHGVRAKPSWYAYQMHFEWPSFRPKGGDRYFLFTTANRVKEKFGKDIQLAFESLQQ